VEKLLWPSISEKLKALDPLSTLGEVFAADEPLSPSRIHAIACLPLVERRGGKHHFFWEQYNAASYKDFSTGNLEDYTSMPNEDAITFTIPTRATFTKLTMAHISPDEVEDGTNSPDDFIEEFRRALDCQRALPRVSVAAASPFLFFLPYVVTTPRFQSVPVTVWNSAR
jgi:hypothetical protein